MRLNLNLLLLSLLLAASCSPVSKRNLTRTFRSTSEKFHDHVGFVLYDAGQRKTLFDYNGAKYFTPASNTKIFTLFAGMKLLGDTVPGLRYIVSGDSTIFWGTGDPSFLYRNVLRDSTAYSFLRQQPGQLYFSHANFRTSALGRGWAWDDYSDYYSAERSGLPVYGNVATVTESAAGARIAPDFFEGDFLYGKPQKEAEVLRNRERNKFTYFRGEDSGKKVIDVPIKLTDSLTAALLSDTLKRTVVVIQKPLEKNARTLWTVPSDSLYSVMMQDSDNFIAEQLLLMCAGVISDTLQPEIAIRHMKKNYLHDLPDEPVWRDGSGLSRFNLFTPRSIVRLWEKLYIDVPRERLFPLLAIGGKKGTIRRYYKNDPPYVYGKTGSLANTHCLSGFLLTRKGKVLIFSFMNNHYVQPTSAVRDTMQEILKKIYEHY